MSKETNSSSSSETFEISLDAPKGSLSEYGYPEGSITTTLDESLDSGRRQGDGESDPDAEEGQGEFRNRRGTRGKGATRRHEDRKARAYRRERAQNNAARAGKGGDQAHGGSGHTSAELGARQSGASGWEVRESLRVTSVERNVPRGGKEARKPSEDTVLRNDELGIYGVFDGVGGRRGGDVASRSAAATIENIIQQLHAGEVNKIDHTDPDDNKTFVKEVLVAANEDFKEQQEKNPLLSGMATTATILHRFHDAEDREMAAFASVGDTSLLRVRNGEVEFITREEFLPDKPNLVTNLLNGNESFDVDAGNLGVMEIQSGDRLVLLSDGISGDWPAERLSMDEYKAALDPANNQDPESAIDALIDASRKEDDKGVVVIDIEGRGIGTPEAEQHEPDSQEEDAEEKLDRALKQEGTVVIQRDSGDPFRVADVFEDPYTSRLMVKLEYVGDNPARQREINIRADNFLKRTSLGEADPKRAWWLPYESGGSDDEGGSENAAGTGTGQQPAAGSGEQQPAGLNEEDRAAYTRALDEYARFMEQEGKFNEYQRWADEFIQNEVKLFGASLLEREATEAESALMETRARLAEAAVRAREGKLIGNKKLRAELEAATQDYQDAWAGFMDELQQRTNASSEYVHALLAAADAREEGALAGEEANYYLELQNQWSKFDHLAAVYEKMSPWERRAAMGVGILATASIGGIAGLAGAGGGAAAGLAASGRFGKVSFSGEVKRRVNKLNRSEREKQEASTLRLEETGTSAYLGYRQRHRRFQDINQRRQSGPDAQELAPDAKQFLAEDMHARQDRTAERTAEEADGETKAKRRVARKAGTVAAGGALAGNLLEGVLESVGIGAEDVDSGRRLDDLESGLEEAEERNDALEQENQELEQENERLEERLESEQADDGTPGETAESDAETTSEVSEQAQYLYGEMAGDTIEIDVSGQGEEYYVWNQLEAKVDSEMPGVSHDEKQRLVGNMLNALENEYPGQNFNHVHPGDSFRITLPR